MELQRLLIVDAATQCSVRCNTVQCRVAMAEWLARRTPNHKIVGSSPAKSQSAHQNCPVWAAGGDNGVSVHSAVNEYLALIDRDGNCT